MQADASKKASEEAYGSERRLRIKAVEIEDGCQYEWVTDLQVPNQLLALYLSFANGVLEQVRFDAESEEGLEVLRGIAGGAGACDLVPDSSEYAHLPISREGYQYFLQGNRNIILIAKSPHPELFEDA